MPTVQVKKHSKRSTVKKSSKRSSNKSIQHLEPGLYKINGKIGFLGYQTKLYAFFIELSSGTAAHPVKGLYVKKTTAVKLSKNEITKEMLKQWDKIRKIACQYVAGKECRLHPKINL